MIRNYLKLTLRNLKKHKGYSFINIAGLAIGMACCILILLYVADELSYDNYHENVNRIYRVGAISSIGTTTRHYATVPPALAPELVDAIPEIESAARIFDSFELQGRLDEGEDGGGGNPLCFRRAAREGRRFGGRSEWC